MSTIARAELAALQAWIGLDAACNPTLRIAGVELSYGPDDDPAAVLAGAERLAATAARYRDAVWGSLSRHVSNFSPSAEVRQAP